ncbi:MAG TPA: class I SAM-dependent methyltransferase [Acidimicrobiales bacterium]|nr:class I SAM-dependent methyltransferase [Acidimicrobiales bacterium]
MHESAFEKVRAFRNAYFGTRQDERLRVLDVGSGSPAGARSCRDLFVPPIFDYVGLDIVEGHNVDYVPADPYRWSELGAESFDVVVSNQVFEHVPYFWVTAAEIARVVAPGGLVTVISPSSGDPHRFPLDCWRFYPDSWAALCDYVGLELLESYQEPVTWRKVIPGVYWRDAMMVARKPALEPDARTPYYERLDAIVATRMGGPAAPLVANKWGAATRAYERTHTLPVNAMLSHPLYVRKLVWPRVRRAWASSWGGAWRRHIRARQGREALEHGAQALPWP